jgi:hypothetical protein
MDRAEQNVRAAARMYEMRETAQRLFGDNYEARVEPWKAAVAKVAARLHVGVLHAALCMAKPTNGHGADLSELDVLLLVSAAADLCEQAEQGPARGPDGTRASNS